MLTQREIRVCLLLSQDKSVKEISHIEGKSANTISTQIKSAKLKLGASTEHGLVAKFIYEMLNKKTAALMFIVFALFLLAIISGVFNHEHIVFANEIFK